MAREGDDEHHHHHHRYHQHGDEDADAVAAAEREQQEEHEHFLDVLGALAQYSACNLPPLDRQLAQFASLPPHHKAAVPGFEAECTAVRACIAANSAFLDRIVAQSHVFEDGAMGVADVRECLGNRTVSPMNADKVRSILRLFVRDWGAEGEAERRACHQPLLRALQEHKPVASGGAGRPAVLVPGAGLGRLAWELARLGYASQGNEFSYFCLVASSFVLNHTEPDPLAPGAPRQHTIFPFVHGGHNVKCNADRTRPVLVPDVAPASMGNDCDFSMTAGDFMLVYTEPRQWDAVATCFFLDTAHNVLEYVERIRTILKDDGVWVNVGPLLYHYSDVPGELSVELSYEQLRAAVEALGFRFVEERWVRSPYTGNSRSMLQTEYDCVFFVAKKRGV